ncbi:hypothetical protein D7Z54_14420 [Salibacterium salarium]|uniref:Uncharacterized protein n=1 Tax=Salibacterium salarium TaxID=284579 RepID=A0A428N2Z7_9BACI|nr:hypothetical protein [Salibacterium salarium]RSL32642.1 hypothetical protein D7Z54_14420 [Salibacterium salarium]
MLNKWFVIVYRERWAESYEINNTHTTITHCSTKEQAARAISDMNGNISQKVLNVFQLDEDGGTVPYEVTLKGFELELVPLYEVRGG